MVAMSASGHPSAGEHEHHRMEPGQGYAVGDFDLLWSRRGHPSKTPPLPIANAVTLVEITGSDRSPGLDLARQRLPRLACSRSMASDRDLTAED